LVGHAKRIIVDKENTRSSMAQAGQERSRERVLSSRSRLRTRPRTTIKKSSRNVWRSWPARGADQSGASTETEMKAKNIQKLKDAMHATRAGVEEDRPGRRHSAIARGRCLEEHEGL